MPGSPRRCRRAVSGQRNGETRSLPSLRRQSQSAAMICNASCGSASRTQTRRSRSNWPTDGVDRQHHRRDPRRRCAISRIKQATNSASFGRHISGIIGHGWQPRPAPPCSPPRPLLPPGAVQRKGTWLTAPRLGPDPYVSTAVWTGGVRNARRTANLPSWAKRPLTIRQCRIYSR
jgi:hypothetical protein